MPRPSRHRKPILADQQDDLARVSLACATGDHHQCSGRVAVRRQDGPGRVYESCECKVCLTIGAHTAPRARQADQV